MDTYVDPDYPLEKEFEWINNHTRYTPFIGETNKVSSYNNTKNAIPFLDLMNAHSLNIEYHPNVLNKWKSSSFSGMNAYEYIGMKFGYRFVLNNTELVQSGGTLRLNLELTNTGFGHLLKEKKFELVLKQDNRIYRAGIDEDPRLWDKNEPVSRTFYFQLPSEISTGDCEVYLGLSSTFENLRNNPSYSVRFANKNIWEADLGLNRIGVISLTSPGGSGKNELLQIR